METIFKAATAYLVLLFALRVTGRRSIERMTPFEQILIFILGGTAVRGVMGDDNSMTNSLVAITTITLLHAFLGWLKHQSPRLRKIADGTPVLVLGDGQWNDEHMRMVRVKKEDVMAAARQHGVDSLERIRYAIVERNGAISIIKAE